MSIPLVYKKSLNHPPPPFISQSPRSRCFSFLPIYFSLYFNQTDNAQLCTGKIETINSNNIENRP